MILLSSWSIHTDLVCFLTLAWCSCSQRSLALSTALIAAAAMPCCALLASNALPSVLHMSLNLCLASTLSTPPPLSFTSLPIALPFSIDLGALKRFAVRVVDSNPRIPRLMWGRGGSSDRVPNSNHEEPSRTFSGVGSSWVQFLGTS